MRCFLSPFSPKEPQRIEPRQYLLRSLHFLHIFLRHQNINLHLREGLFQILIGNLSSPFFLRNISPLSPSPSLPSAWEEIPDGPTPPSRRSLRETLLSLLGHLRLINLQEPKDIGHDGERRFRFVDQVHDPILRPLRIPVIPIKRPLPTERRLTTMPWTKDVFALITSKEQGFRFCGMIELPEQCRSFNRTMLNSRVDKRISVWAMVER